MKKVEYLKENNKASLVRELVDAGWNSEDAINYVYDIEVLTKEEFINKYF